MCVCVLAKVFKKYVTYYIYEKNWATSLKWAIVVSAHTQLLNPETQSAYCVITYS